MTLPFSQKFKNGEPNHFIEKIWQSIILLDTFPKFPTVGNAPQVYDTYAHKYLDKFGKRWDGHLTPPSEIKPKLHTIREGNRWKAGDKIHFVVNNRTKNRFQFAPVCNVKGVQKIEIFHNQPFKTDFNSSSCIVLKNISRENEYGKYAVVRIDNIALAYSEVYRLAQNDGFTSVEQFFEWFDKDFEGQIIWFYDRKY